LSHGLLIQRATAYLHQRGLVSCDLRIRDGRFAPPAEAGSLHLEKGEKLVDARGLLVLPGAIDGHVHFDDPGFTWRETFATGSAAAAAGGVTTVVDMPCTSRPPLTTVKNLHEKLSCIEGRSHVDFMFWGGLCANAMSDGSNWNQDMKDLRDAGVAGIKVYLLSGMDSFRDLNDEELMQAARCAKSLSLPLGVHAEDRGLFEKLRAECVSMSLSEVQAYCLSRPSAVEVRAMERLIHVAQKSDSHIHIVHLASAEALNLLSEARARGLHLTAETAPHYLSFTQDDFAKLGSKLKTAPVVKTASDREGLWRGVKDKEILFIATDHAAGKWPDEKQTGSFARDYGGIPGVELLMPWLHSEGLLKGHINLADMIRLLCTAPAEFFGIQQRKGRIQEAYDADFVLFDPSKTWTVEAAALHNLNRYTPFEGWPFTGCVQETWLRGECIFSRNEQKTQSARGRFLKRGEN
jgi:allantoinase